MKRLTRYMLVLSTTLLVGSGWAGLDKTSDEPQKLSIALDLDDGSHVIGLPGVESIPVQTSYAKMDIKLNEILTIRIDEDHEKVAIDLRNGDKLKGVINLEPIKLETVFGKVKIGLEHIRAIDVLLCGKTLQEALTKNLILHYSFDRDEGRKVTDKSVKKNNGDVRGAKWTATGKGSGAYSFDNTGDRIEIAPSSDFNFEKNDFTLALWVYPTIVEGAGQQFWLDRWGGEPMSQHRSWTFLQSGAKIYFAFLPNGAAVQRDIYSKEVLTPNAWQHIVLVRKGETLSMYRNSQIVSGDTVIAETIQSNSQPLWIGDHQNNLTAVCKGSLREVMIFNRALSDSEVKQIYDAQR